MLYLLIDFTNWFERSLREFTLRKGDDNINLLQKFDFLEYKWYKLTKMSNLHITVDQTVEFRLIFYLFKIVCKIYFYFVIFQFINI